MRAGLGESLSDTPERLSKRTPEISSGANEGGGVGGQGGGPGSSVVVGGTADKLTRSGITSGEPRGVVQP